MNITSLLGTTRIARAVQLLRDQRETPATLPLLSRAQLVRADDGEIVAKITGTVTIADIVADDAAAMTKSSDPVQLQQVKIPNIKAGRRFTQAQLDLIRRILQGQGGVWETDSLDGFLRDALTRNQRGVEFRMEQLLTAMVCDDLDYDRAGVKISDMSWGMPSDLKVTPATAWTTANKQTSTPIGDILGVMRTGREKYGVAYDTIMMSSTALDRITESSDFANRAKIFLPSGLDGSLLAGQIQAESDLLGRMLGMAVEINDNTYADEALDGTRGYTRFLPEAYIVLMANSAWANGDMDFANGVVTESLVGSVAGSSVPGGFSGPAYGPVSYVEGSMNPANLCLWSVARGFPRKHWEAATARITGWS